MSLFRYPFSLLAPAGPRSRLSVLIFHRVHRHADPLCPDEMTAPLFDRVLGRLKAWFNVIPLDRAVEDLLAGRLPDRPLCITFDDGYADNYEVALPILKKHGLSATFFIATGYLDGGCMFNDKVTEAIRACGAEVLDLTSAGLGTYGLASLDHRRRAVGEVVAAIKYVGSPKRELLAQEICDIAGVSPPVSLMMSRAQLRDLHRQGMGVGGHTRSHPILAATAGDVAMAELVDGKRDIEEIIGQTVTLLAYPNGRPGIDYRAEHVLLAREAGFRGAVSTAKGVATAGSDVFQIPRFTPWGRSMVKFGARLGLNLRAGDPERV